MRAVAVQRFGTFSPGSRQSIVHYTWNLDGEKGGYFLLYRSLLESIDIFSQFVNLVQLATRESSDIMLVMGF